MQRVSRLFLAALSLILVALVPAAPAAASSLTFNANLTVDCIVKQSDGKYRAVFGYDNYTGYDVTVPVGQNNSMNPASMNGVQTAVFAVGAHRAAFSTPAVNENQKITWSVGLFSVTASKSSPACGPSVSLPAEGNGLAPVIVLALSALAVAFAAVRNRSRRRARLATDEMRARPVADA